MNKFEKQVELINELGGYKKVQELLNTEFNLSMRVQNVTNWYNHRMPFKYIVFLCEKSDNFSYEDFLNNYL